MNYGKHFSIHHGELSDVISQLAELADRVRLITECEALNLMAQAPARDEVSQRVAATLKVVHASFATASDQGQQRLHDVARTLGTYIANVVDLDEGLAS